MQEISLQKLIFNWHIFQNQTILQFTGFFRLEQERVKVVLYKSKFQTLGSNFEWTRLFKSCTYYHKVRFCNTFQMQRENIGLTFQSEISGFFNLCQCTALVSREKVWEECNKFHEKKYINSFIISNKKESGLYWKYPYINTIAL